MPFERKGTAKKAATGVRVVGKGSGNSSTLSKMELEVSKAKVEILYTLVNLAGEKVLVLCSCSLKASAKVVPSTKSFLFSSLLDNSASNHPKG